MSWPSRRPDPKGKDLFHLDVSRRPAQIQMAAPASNPELRHWCPHESGLTEPPPRLPLAGVMDLGPSLTRPARPGGEIYWRHERRVCRVARSARVSPPADPLSPLQIPQTFRSHPRWSVPEHLTGAQSCPFVSWPWTSVLISEPWRTRNRLGTSAPPSPSTPRKTVFPRIGGVTLRINEAGLRVRVQCTVHVQPGRPLLDR